MAYKDLVGTKWDKFLVVDYYSYVSDKGYYTYKYNIKCMNCGCIFTREIRAVREQRKMKCPKCDIKYVAIGDIFERLTVIAGPEIRTEPTKGWKIRWWLCECSCTKKNQLWVNEASLKRGHTKSCGCLQKEVGMLGFKDLQGNVFGRLVAQYCIKDPKSRSHKWVCYCDPKLGGCGTTTHPIKTSILLSGQSQSCGCYNKQRTRETHLGEKHHNWKGGISKLAEQIRGLPQMKQWVHKCYKRDQYTCQYSGVRGSKGNLSVHHIKPFHTILEENNVTTQEEAINCPELWELSNGVTLLRQWHLSGCKNEANSFHNVFGTNHSTQQDFKYWFMQLGSWYA